MATYRTLSLQQKEPTHFLVKYTTDNKLQVRNRIHIKSEGSIEISSLHEVQWFKTADVAPAIILGGGTEPEMRQLLNEKKREKQSTSPSSSPRSPTPPPPKRKCLPKALNVNVPPKKKTTKQQANVLSIGKPAPPAPLPVSSLTTPRTPQTPTTQPTTNQLLKTLHNMFRAQSHQIQQHFQRMEEHIATNNMKMDNFGKRLSALEAAVNQQTARLDSMEAAVHRPAIPQPMESTDFEDVPAKYQLSTEELQQMHKSSTGAGNFSTKLVRRLFPELFGANQLRLNYNYFGGGQKEKTELDPVRREIVKRYTVAFHPEVGPSMVWKDRVVPKINEYLRRKDWAARTKTVDDDYIVQLPEDIEEIELI